MLPNNTVPITAEELLPLKDQGIDLLVHYRFCGNWNVSPLRVLPFGLHEFYRIKAYDYRHYFGEVVDLASKVNDKYLEYLNNGFFLYFNKKDSHILDRNDNWLEFSGNITECKQWLIDHFTAIAAKDLPNYNLKFIFS